jgi:hypothetical protein
MRAPQHERDERAAQALRYIAALNAVPPFDGIQTLQYLAQVRRTVLAHFYPHFAEIFKTGHHAINSL